MLVLVGSYLGAWLISAAIRAGCESLVLAQLKFDWKQASVHILLFVCWHLYLALTRGMELSSLLPISLSIAIVVREIAYTPLPSDAKTTLTICKRSLVKFKIYISIVVLQYACLVSFVSAFWQSAAKID